MRFDEWRGGGSEKFEQPGWDDDWAHLNNGGGHGVGWPANPLRFLIISSALSVKISPTEIV